MQCSPYPSRDILEHQELYTNILTMFGELFEWIEMVVSDISGMFNLALTAL
jgi:hypothetical protein